MSPGHLALDRAPQRQHMDQGMAGQAGPGSPIIPTATQQPIGRLETPFELQSHRCGGLADRPAAASRAGPERSSGEGQRSSHDPRWEPGAQAHLARSS